MKIRTNLTIKNFEFDLEDIVENSSDMTEQEINDSIFQYIFEEVVEAVHIDWEEIE